LCGRLFAELGARVIKVESAARPDGARAGSPAFFARMNAGKQSVILDFASQAGRAELRELIAGADVVIEAARPRALPQLGIDAETIARANRRLTWIGITAYGRTGPWSNAVGFGDDCAAAAGLVVRDESGAPMFVADALADPLAGLMAASAAFAVLAAGGGALIDVALREAALFVAQAPAA
jgi:crotonobetainyl-CoA:carnitine CoA-transferase CaiB-like acyl-CoA transferase